MDLNFRRRYHSNRLLDCTGELPRSSVQCPCFGWKIFGTFSRFKDTVKSCQPRHWSDLERHKATLRMQGGDRYFFLFRRMRCFLVNRVRSGGSSGEVSLFVTNLTAKSWEEEVDYVMYVSYTENKNRVSKTIETECLAHSHNATERDARAFVVCPKDISVFISIEFTKESA